MAAKKEHKDQPLGGLETARCGGGLPREGAGVEKYFPSLESSFSPFENWGKTNFVQGMSGNLLGCPGPLLSKSLCKMSLYSICGPY